VIGLCGFKSSTCIGIRENFRPPEGYSTGLRGTLKFTFLLLKNSFFSYFCPVEPTTIDNGAGTEIYEFIFYFIYFLIFIFIFIFKSRFPTVSASSQGTTTHFGTVLE